MRRYSWITTSLYVCAALLVAHRPAQAQTRINGILAIPADDAAFDGEDEGDATVKGNVRSPGGQMAQRLQRAVRSGQVPLPMSRVRGHDDAGERGEEGGLNVQINDPALDHVVTFDPSVVRTRPFEFSTQSETSMVSRGNHITVGYNSSASAVVEFFPGFGLFFTRILFSGFSTSHDGGRTWTSGFVPPVSPNAPFTFGDPSLAMDRRGNIYYASLGTDADGNDNTVIINKSTDHGATFGAATVVAVDNGSDKEWLAIGPDPKVRARDNLYVTWTSFVADATGRTVGSQLWLARSTDGGLTWSPRLLFAPVDDGVNSAFIQFSNPVVDAASGRLYVPFLHFSNTDADNVRVLVSDDGGSTFRFLAFNVPGAVDARAYPNVTPGVLNDCGNGGIRNSLHQGPSAGPGRDIGLPTFRFTQATRLITQPTTGAAQGRLLIALNSSTSPFFDDPAAGSEVKLLFSRDGGNSWASPLRVAASTAADPQHVHPALSLTADGSTAFVAYYAQQANEQLRTDMATLSVGTRRVRLVGTSGLSDTAFDLTPSNIPFPSPTNPFRTTNYDRIIASCYNIGEYMSIAAGGSDDGEGPMAAWGDNRNAWTGPPGSAAPFTHAQPDVFFTRSENEP